MKSIKKWSFTQVMVFGFLTLKDAVAIVLGILFVFEFPQSCFRRVLTDKSK